MKIIVGMSGGVDSTAAALILKNKGHEVIGLHLKCCDTVASGADEEAAEAVAKALGIRLLKKDMRALFRDSIERMFIGSYMHGMTPSPCCLCNRVIKWRAMLETVRELDADMCATGHYADIGSSDGRFFIKRQENNEKDQSYMLYNLSQEQLSLTAFPLAGMKKDEVRALAAGEGLGNASRKDSQDICFIENESYSDYISRNAPGLTGEESDLCFECPGNFVDMSGRVLGRHRGIVNYTVGQRKGLGIALGRRVFVKEIRPLENEVVLAGDEDVYTDSVTVGQLNWQKLSPETFPAINTEGIRAQIRIRYAHKGSAGLIRHTDGICSISFDEPVRAATRGQAAVFYDEDGCVLGGGIIS